MVFELVLTDDGLIGLPQGGLVSLDLVGGLTGYTGELAPASNGGLGFIQYDAFDPDFGNTYKIGLKVPFNDEASCKVQDFYTPLTIPPPFTGTSTSTTSTTTTDVETTTSTFETTTTTTFGDGGIGTQTTVVPTESTVVTTDTGTTTLPQDGVTTTVPQDGVTTTLPQDGATTTANVPSTTENELEPPA